jgi:hypothetical protein
MKAEEIEGIEGSELRAVIATIHANPRLSDEERRHAIALLWTSAVTDEISTEEQYVSYKKEREEIETRVHAAHPLPTGASTGVGQFLRSSDAAPWLKTREGIRWAVLNGAIMSWEVGAEAKRASA